MASAKEIEVQETAVDEVVNAVVDDGAHVGVRRRFTIPGRDPFDEIEWELRNAFIPGKDKPVFEQKGVEFPKFWSQTATNIVAQKYFRGRLSSPERESSVRQMIGRVVSTIGGWGRAGGYFADEEEAETFEAELKAILVNQLAAFNSPVWFNVGFEEKPQCSACVPYHGLVSTPEGMVQIGELVEREQVGREVYDSQGVTRIVAVKHNGRKPVYRVTLRNGQFVEATPDHVVKSVRERRTEPVWLRVDELKPGMRMHLHPHRAKVLSRVLAPVGGPAINDAVPVTLTSDEGVRACAEAALAGWLQADGSVGVYNGCLRVEFQVANEDEYAWVMHNLAIAVPGVHRGLYEVRREDGSVSCRRIILAGEVLRHFVERWDLLTRGTKMRVPKQLWTASHDQIAAYLRSVFQADGYVTVQRSGNGESGRVAFAVISEKWTEDIQLLLNVLGIYSRRKRKLERRSDRHDLHEVSISIGSERARFVELVGFVSREKQEKLLESLTLRDLKTCPNLREEEIVSIELVGVDDVYDIQTESGEFLLHNVAVHNCFILSIEDSMESILDWIRREGIIFRGGSGSGVNLSRLRSSKEQLSKGGHASGPVSFMRGADASAGTIKSGGKTRRAAKMVVLDVDHPDIEEFIWCKAHEEEKARVLEAAGYDMSLNSPDWASIQYQNANNSVRVTDAFMEAAVAGREWNLTARTDGTVVRTVDASGLLKQIAEAAWRCADPGVQYDTTINAWHTCPNSGRINASNPCCFVGETLVDTEEGLLRFDELLERKLLDEPLPRVWSFALGTGEAVLRPLTSVWIAGAATCLVEVTTHAGHIFRCTPEHRFLTAAGYLEAERLEPGTELVASVSEDALPSEGALASLRRVAVRDTVATVEAIELAEPVFVYDLEAAEEHNFSVGSHSGPRVVVHNSEYMHLDDSACNLASLNLMKFRRDDGELDVEAFEHAVDTVFLAQEIVVGYSSYPTPEIERNAKAFRQLGLGYANLGALLMARGLPYDSDEGRAYAAAITALMTGRAYRKSAEIAGRMGPFAGYRPNAAAMLGVIAKHRAAVGNIQHTDSVPDDLLAAARQAWDDALNLGEVSGFRNAQSVVIAPTGCLVGDSLISTSRGLVRLRSLGNPVGPKWQPLDVDVSTDEGPRGATQFYVNGFERVVSIETGRGYRIQGTPTHRIKVVGADGRWAWKRFAEIEEGDRVPLMLNGLVGEPAEVELPPLGEMHWNSDFRTRVPRRVTPELAELVGYFMGDGSLHAKGLRLCVSNLDGEVVGRLMELGEELFGLAAQVSERSGYTEVALNSVPLTIWWEACGFSKLPPAVDHSGKGWHAYIPDAILHTNDPEVYAAFIRGLFEADGTTNNGYVSWSTVTKSFSRDVQTLLLALGFVTTRKVDDAGSNWGPHERYTLRLLDVSSADRYLSEIGFLSHRKTRSLMVGSHRQASRHDHIPVSRELVDELAPENDSLRKTMLMALARRGDVSRRSATALLERTTDPELEQLLGFYYDTVAHTEVLDDQPTFDLSVPDNVTYMANGFVSHNTISFMMDCDTTGIEPDFSLVKSKKLVGGGEITIVNKTVPMALEKLGYAPGEIEEVVAYIDERNTIVGAPYVKPEHYPVYDCAIGERAIRYMGHVKMMGAVQPFISGAISKCVVGETLVPTAEGLVRIGSLYRGEAEDSFRDMRLPLASLDGLRETDAFYYGGARQTLEVVLRSGHRLVGTPNHRVLVATSESGLHWRRLDELEPGDHVATQYGDDLWSSRPARFDDFAASKAYGSQKVVTVPEEMTEDLAFFLGAYAAEGHTTRSNYTVRIANADEEVIARIVELGRVLFGIRARVARDAGKCPSVDFSSKTLVEFLDHLGCGDRARNKRIPDAVLCSPRELVLAFLEGLSLDSYIPSAVPKWAICVASNGLLDDLQAVLTNLGVVHSRISKFNAEYERSFDEVNVFGRYAQKLTAMLRFPEAHKAARASQLQEMVLAQSTADVVPGIGGRELYELIPTGRSGRSGRGTGRSRQFRHLIDPRTAHVSWTSLGRVATVPGVELPDWLETVLERNLHFSPVSAIADGGEREVYDVSVPGSHAFVGNGIVSHNTVNLPEQATVDEVAQLLIDAWRLGVKAIAIYRDNCKVAQPLSGKSEAGTLVSTAGLAPHPQRRRLPDDRTEIGRKFRVGEYEGYIHVGLFDDGTPGDIFVDIAKEGTTLAGLMNAFMISASLGLQYGVPLEVYVSKFAHMRFEPSGQTNDADIRIAKSIVDYIFRWMGKKFLTPEQQEEVGILSAEVRARLTERYNGGAEERAGAAPIETPPPGQTALFNQWEDAVECARCGGRMVRTGSCYTCRDCGTNTGCS